MSSMEPYNYRNAIRDRVAEMRDRPGVWFRWPYYQSPRTLRSKLAPYGDFETDAMRHRGVLVALVRARDGNDTPFWSEFVTSFTPSPQS